jgi:hypothetical protein
VSPKKQAARDHGSVTASASEPEAGTGSVRPEYAKAGQWKSQPNAAPAPAN